MRPIRHQSDLDDLRRAAQAYGVIAAWAGAGLFKTLAEEGPLAAEDLPGDDRAVSISAGMLTHLGLLTYDGRRWGLTLGGRALLDGGALRLSGAEGALGDMSRLDAVLREGGPVRAADGASRVTEGGVREHDKEGARAFMDMLYRRADSVHDVAAAMIDRLGEGAHVLDVGGGHGRYGEALLDRGARVTLLDRPVILDIARERYADRLTYRTANFLADDLGGPYDGALLSNIVHGLGRQENLGLFRRLARSLRPGGLIVLKDMFVDELGAHPEEATFFGLTMLMYTREGSSYGVGEMSDLLKTAGFEGEELQVHVDERYTLLMARRA